MADVVSPRKIVKPVYRFRKNVDNKLSNIVQTSDLEVKLEYRAQVEKVIVKQPEVETKQTIAEINAKVAIENHSATKTMSDIKATSGAPNIEKNIKPVDEDEDDDEYDDEEEGDDEEEDNDGQYDEKSHSHAQPFALDPMAKDYELWKCIRCNNSSNSKYVPKILNGKAHLRCSVCHACNCFYLDDLDFYTRKKLVPRRVSRVIEAQVEQIIRVQDWVESLGYDWITNNIDEKNKEQFMRLQDPDIKKIVAIWEAERIRGLDVKTKKKKKKNKKKK